jgi:hypothetical protein
VGMLFGVVPACLLACLPACLPALTPPKRNHRIVPNFVGVTDCAGGLLAGESACTTATGGKTAGDT